MATLEDWGQLPHQRKMQLFNEHNDEELIQQYLPEGLSPDDFRKQLLFERRFWNPRNAGDVRAKEGLPTKETTIGAWRDLSRAEAILELIDNSIDAWMRRRRLYPRRTASKLMVFIDLGSLGFHGEGPHIGVLLSSGKPMIAFKVQVQTLE